jgi:hypothetical protein
LPSAELRGRPLSSVVTSGLIVMQI